MGQFWMQILEVSGVSIGCNLTEGGGVSRSNYGIGVIQTHLMHSEISHPNFFIVGAAKGGTTSLHAYLSQHAQVYMSPIKETNFFAQADMRSELFNREYRYDVALDLDRYLGGNGSARAHR